MKTNCLKYIMLPLLSLILMLNSCMFVKLQDNLDEMAQLGTIRGIVQSSGRIRGDLRVFLVLDDPASQTVIDYRVMNKPGEFIFHVEPGRYRVFAFDDANQDGKFQSRERIGRAAGIVILDATSMPDRILITLPNRTSPRTLLTELTSKRNNLATALPDYKTSLGSVVDLRDDFFSSKYASMGMWEPLDFAREVPIGLFFLEEYDRNKTPVLFVHGISGTPRNFKDLIAGLDRNRFQPWVLYYPSGIRLDEIAGFADDLIEDLHAKLKFKQLAIVSHSMGGLVSRGFINRHSRNHNPPFITLFISISTPWNGHDAAAVGVRRAPAVVPVWRDLAPGSHYLTSLFDIPLPEILIHHLLFGFKGKSGRYMDTSNDGTISLASQLRTEAQIDADTTRGFDESHVGILTNQDVIDWVNQLLDEWDQPVKSRRKFPFLPF